MGSVCPASHHGLCEDRIVQPEKFVVIALLNYFFELCLLRRKPQDLPASSALFALILVVNLLVGVVMLQGRFGGMAPALVVGLIDTLLLLGGLWLLLRWRGHPARLVQSATALIGSSVLLALVAIPLLSMVAPEPTAGSGLASLLYLLLMIWAHVVMGHILRHALDVPLGNGVALAIAFTLLSTLVVQNLMAGP